METNNTIELNGLSPRHVAQIIRSKMLQKAKPSGKTYNRKKLKLNLEIKTIFYIFVTNKQRLGIYEVP
jgi:hypothetical protein